MPLLTGGDVMLLSSSLSDQLATVALVKRRLLVATARGAADRRRARVRGRGAARTPAQPPATGRRSDRRGRVRRARDRQRPRRGRPAGRVVRPDAPAARPARPRAQGVRRERVARAADAAVLDRRVPRAPRRRGSRREHADGVPRDDARARSTGSPTSPPTCSISRGWTPAGSGSRTRRSGWPRSRARWRRTSSPLADASGHTLLLDVDEDAWAHADEERIQQIARALTGNALVHTPPGTTVRLRSSSAAAASPWRSRTTAPGIPAEHLERVFQRFYRVDGGQASGSGLGLAIARELAGRMGGTVTVTSRPGRDGLHARAAGRRRGAAPAGAAVGLSAHRFHVETVAARPRFHVETRPSNGRAAERARLQ